MKKMLLLLILFFIKNELKAMPSYSEVISFYYKNINQPIGTYAEFSKKKEGWFVIAKSYENDQGNYESQMLWSQKRNNWILNPKLLTNTISVNEAKERVYHFKLRTNYALDSLFFKIHDYYGYAGWDWDVINSFSSKSNLNTIQLESLARANGNYAMGFFHNQYGFFFENNNPFRKPLLLEETISSTRADSFTYYSKIAIENFTNIYKIDSTYQTILGAISNKVNNEKVFAYYTLDIMGFENKGLSFLKDVHFNDSIMNIARTRLQYLIKDAVVFTLGDLDHLPLLYLQKIENNNNAVILNYNMLQLPKYYKFIQRKYPKLKITIPDTVFTKWDYLLKDAYNSNSKRLLWNDWIKQLKYNNNTRWISYKSSNIILNINHKPHDINIDRYIDRAAFLFLDLIQNNNNHTFYLSSEFSVLDYLSKSVPNTYLRILK